MQLDDCVSLMVTTGHYAVLYYLPDLKDTYTACNGLSMSILRMLSNVTECFVSSTRRKKFTPEKEKHENQKKYKKVTY